MRHVARVVASSVVMLGFLSTGSLEATPRPAVFDTSASLTQPFLLKVRDASDLNPTLVVEFPGGRFLQLSKRKWVEVGKRNKIAFTFELAGMDGRNFRLWDPSRQVHIYIDLGSRQILYAPDGEDLTPLYPILGVMKPSEETDNPDVAENDDGEENIQIKRREIRYSCSEGIPLTVRLVNRDGNKVAFISHDGGEEVRLKRIKSQSGTKYSDGDYALVIKGRNVILARNGDMDICLGK